jgi:hypothetical protein
MERIWVVVFSLALVASASASCTIVQANLSEVNAVVEVGANGCHFSPLNHQLAFVYSQMVYDESFEQSIANKPLPKGNEVSMGWLPMLSSANAGEVTWQNGTEKEVAFNGNVSVRLSLKSPATAQASVAVANRGLFKSGFAFKANRSYDGYFFVRASGGSDKVSMLVSFEDWGSDPYGMAGRKLLASMPVVIDARNSSWVQVPLVLTPSGPTTCVKFPPETAPLDCGSDEMDNASCKVCGGTLLITLLTPGASVDVVSGSAVRGSAVRGSAARGTVSGLQVNTVNYDYEFNVL